jgi:hypothetical protein
MSKAPHSPASLRHLLGAARHARPATCSGTGARQTLSVFHSALLLFIAGFLALAILAPSARAAATTICTSGSSAGQCENPSGLAVDQTGGPGGPSGTVYVADTNNRRIDVFDSTGKFLMAFGLGVSNGANELQTCTALCGVGHGFPSSVAVDPSSHAVYVSGQSRVQKFAYNPGSGHFEFLLATGGGVLDGGATGTGDLTAGSTTVANLTTTGRRFIEGQTITAPGIPAGTRIVEIRGSGAAPTLVLSQPAIATATAVSLAAPTPPANNPVNEVQTVALAGAPTGGVFGLGGIGASFTAATTSGSPKIAAVSETSLTTLSLTAGSDEALAHQATGHLTGETIIGTGIPPGTTITQQEGTSEVGLWRFHLSAAATVTNSAARVSFTKHTTGTLTTGSTEVTGLPGSPRALLPISAGEAVSGAGIPSGSEVVAINQAERSFTLSAAATASGAVALSATVKPPHFLIGESVSGPGIPPGATIASVAADGDPVLSTAATATTAGSTFDSGVSASASASALQSLLESSLGSGAASVSGTSGGPWQVEFKGRFADTDVPQLLSEAAGLTPPGSVGVTTDIQGAGGPETCTQAEVGAGYLCLTGTPAAGEGQLDGESPLAIDGEGHLWVGATDRIEEFSANGAFLSQVGLPNPGIVQALALDAAGDLYTVAALNSVQQINPPSSGTYTFTVQEGRALTTRALSAEPGSEASAAEVQDALNAALGTRRYEVSGPIGGPFLAELPDGNQLGGGRAIAISVGSVTVAKEGGPAFQVDKLDPAGTLLEALDVGGSPQALGLDPASGELYVGDCGRNEFGTACKTPYTLLQFDPAGEQTEAFGFGEVIGGPARNSLAFADSAGRLFLASSASQSQSAVQSLAVPPPGPLVGAGSTQATTVRKTTATLKAEVNPEGKPTTYRFQYIAAAKFKEDGEQFGAGTEETPPSASIGEDFSFHEATADLSGLTPGVSYRFRLVATNSNAPAGIDGETASLETLPPVAIDSTSAAAVTATSATLQAQLNPLGEAATYSFQYLSEAAYQANLAAAEDPFTGATQAPLEPASIGAGESDVSVAVHIQSLQAQTTYRYRVLARDGVAPAGFPGPTLAFTTQSTASASLLDGRQPELVSPPDKHGARPQPISLAGVVQAAASGGAVTFLTNTPTQAEPQGNSNLVQVLSARGPGGWSSGDIAAPHAAPTGVSVGQGYEYRAFSTDLASAAVQPIGPFEPALSPQATEQTAFLRSDLTAGQFCSSSCYQPLVTAANVPEGIHFGGEAKCLQTYCGPEFRGATPDLSHLVLSSSVAGLTPAAPAGSLYEWSAGGLSLISILPNGSSAIAPQFGSGPARGMISADGSRVVFRTAGSLFLRVNTTSPQSVSGACDEPERACTIRLDAQQGGIPTTPAAILQGASADDSTIYFTDTEPLTADSGAQGNKPDLYRCRIEESAGQLGCALTDLTPRTTEGESAAVQGAIPGLATDASAAYFVAEGDLTGEQANSAGAAAQPGQPNLYLDREGRTTFIATLAGADSPDWGGLRGELAQLTARVSPDGRSVAFMSSRPLLGYDNHDAASGRADEEVYLYHAPAAAGEEGNLICASCNPTGARPHGVEYHPGSPGGFDSLPLAGGDHVWDAHDWLAANIPGWTAFQLGDALYQSRYLSDSGRLFFNSSDALLPADTNGVGDVYEYEPSGAGDCGASSPTYFSDRDGCLGLISSGASSEESAFLDAGESGADVFFLTTSRLDPRDTDTALDVYDAHACSAESPCPPPPAAKPPACEGDACQAPATPPLDPTPGSLTFNGAGNVLECPKGKVKKSGKCAKKQSKKHHRKSNKKKGKKQKNKRTNANRGGAK